jgi:XapX domain-containing protein
MNIAKLNLGRETRSLLISFAAGILAGLVFHILHEPAPAPPWQALAALLGIVLGERLGIHIKTSRRSLRVTQHPGARQDGRRDEDREDEHRGAG